MRVCIGKQEPKIFFCSSAPKAAYAIPPAKMHNQQICQLVIMNISFWQILKYENTKTKVETYIVAGQASHIMMALKQVW